MGLRKADYYTTYQSPVGLLYLEAKDDKLIALDFANEINQAELAEVPESQTLEIFQLTANWLDLYFAGENPSPTLIKKEFIGTDFQKLVWHELEKIGYGQTQNYGEIAKVVASEMKRPSMSSQAVGNAIGQNPLAILVPCHRVVGKDGNLTGYSGGLTKKIKLLQLERIDVTKFYWPRDATTSAKHKHGKSKQVEQLTMDFGADNEN